MIAKFESLEKVRREGLQKGPGGAWCSYPIPVGKAPEGSCWRMVGRIALDPGAAIGAHLHGDDEEIYVVLSGTGVYSDGDVESPVGPGDVTVTFRGERHALRNTGDVPLEIMAIIAG